MTLDPMVAVWLAPRFATLVLRQKRIFPSAEPTTMLIAQQFDVKIVPLRAFSGRLRRPVG